MPRFMLFHGTDVSSVPKTHWGKCFYEGSRDDAGPWDWIVCPVEGTNVLAHIISDAAPADVSFEWTGVTYVYLALRCEGPL